MVDGGIGAPRKALENIGIEVKSIDYVEILPYAVTAYNSMYDLNYKPTSVIDWDLNVDLLIHGSPCQDFSSAGKNNLSTGRSILYERTLQIIQDVLNPRPKYVIWENVTGLLTKKHRHHFDHYLKTMEELGYKNSYEVLNAVDFGIPQTRKRVFVVSIRNDLNKEFDFNKLEKVKPKHIKEFLDSDVEGQDITQKSMINSIYNNKSYISISQVNTITTKPIRWNTTLVFKDLNEYEKFDKEEGCVLYKKLQIENIHTKLRYKTARENWRLMGFDDIDYDNCIKQGIPDSAMHHLAGNSIVVPVLEAIFKELIKE